MRLIYTFGIYAYSFLVSLVALKNSKAKTWVKGRKNWKNKITKLGKKEVFWFHCASLGEYEQAKPIIKALKNRGEHILVSFFSPSGYKYAKDLQEDEKTYLPIDTVSNAKYFIKNLNIKCAVFIKYEFWYNYLNQLNKENIPYYFVSSTFRKNQIFFSPWGGWFKKHLHRAKNIYVQNEISKLILTENGINNVTVSGDTRYDRVSEIAQQNKVIQFIELFKGDKNLILAGSSWKEEEDLISNYDNTTGAKIIIAPHDISKNHITEIKSKFDRALLFSEANETNTLKADVLIIDSIGTLSHLYKYADIALIGGAFGKGLHNILEAAVFGCPVIFGPHHQKFPEGEAIIKANGGFAVSNQTEFDSIINNFLSNDLLLQKTKNAAKEFVENRKGATDIVCKELEQY